jgi:hypothetical protein
MPDLAWAPGEDTLEPADPAAVTGSDDEKRQAFLDTYTELKRRIGEFAASAPTRPRA